MKTGKIIMSLALMLVIVLSSSSADAQYKSTGERTFGFYMGDKGMGAGFNYFKGNEKSLYSLDFEIQSVKGDDEFVYNYYNPYTGRYEQLKTNDKNFLLVPMLLGYKRYLWVDSIADNFKPYLRIAVGPVLGLDLVEDVGFTNQFTRAKAHYTVGLRLNAGAVIKTDKSSIISLSLGYSSIDFGKRLDGRTTMGGFGIRFGFGKSFR